MRRWMLVTSLGLLAGCAADTSEEGGSGSELTKEEASRQGKADWPADYCEEYGWYGDGVCDPFCPNPDPDCEADAYDPCEGLSCGDHCNPCPPDDPSCIRPLVITTCDPEGNCTSSPSDCEEDDCEPMDARGQGACRAFFGVAWDGSECAGVGGCSCEGADCDALFDTLEDCEAAHSHCTDDEGELCSNTCRWSNDGYCDDGGEGSEYDLCDLGTDCADCGVRHDEDGGSPEECKVGGCSGQLCYDPAEGSGISTCEWTPAYACYAHAICERQSDGSCGWTSTEEFDACMDEVEGGDDREPITDYCARRSGECTTDADCVTGGCGGELCYNPDEGGGFTTCDCGAPADAGCGCVDGRCSWYN